VKGARPKERQSTDADTHRNMAAEGGLRVIKDKQKISDRCFWQVDRKVRSET
jgi:outer membrane biogenesis lipoprotein LolB